WIEVADLGCSQPEIPIHFLWNVKFSGWGRYTLRPNGSVSPYMHSMYVADYPALDPGFYQPGIISATTLVAHLRNHLVFFCGLGKDPGFINIMREWLFAIHMFSELHGGQSNRGVHMVRCSDDHCIDVLCLFIQQVTIILIIRSTGPFSSCLYSHP